MPKQSSELIIDRPYDASLRRGGTGGTTTVRGATTFLGLSDTPSSYSGAGELFVKVKVTEDGLEFVTGSGGAVDSVNGQTGVVVLDSDDIAEGVTNLYLTQERVEDYVAGQFTGNTGIIDATYNDTTGVITLTLDVSAADRYLYSTAADTWAEGTITAAGRAILDDTDAAAQRTTLGLVIGTNVQAYDATLLSIAALGTVADRIAYTTALDTWAETPLTSFMRTVLDDTTQGAARTTLGITAYDQETVEDFVGAMLGGTQTGITVAYVDASGLITFDAQTAGDARYGRLATANTWTQNQSIASTQTTGNALNVTRNLTSTSTDSPVVSFVQDHASDDQMVLRIQQDGAAAIVSAYDLTDLVFQIADGGRVLITPTATSGASLSVVRDLASASTDWPVVDLIQENSGDDQALLQLRQDGTGAILVLKDGANTVLTVADGGGWVVNQVGTSGVGFSFNRNLASASTDNVVFEVVQDNTGDDQAAVRIQQDGTGNILDLYDGGTLVFEVRDGGRVVASQSGTTGVGFSFRRNLTSTSTDAAVFEIVQDHATDDQAVLRIQQDGSGNLLQLYNGATLAASFDNDGNLGIGVAPNNSLRIYISDGAGRIRMDSTDNNASVGFVMAANGASGTQRIGGFYWKAHETAALSYFGITANNSTFQLAVLQDGKVGIGTTTPAARLDVIESTLGNAVQKLSSTATNDDPTELVYQNRVATTDATVTTLHTFTIPASTTYAIEARVVARRTGGVSGAAEDGAYYVLNAVYKNVAGTATIIGAVEVTTPGESQVAWDATIDVTGATARVRVTGAANNNITWHMTARAWPVSS